MRTHMPAYTHIDHTGLAYRLCIIADIAYPVKNAGGVHVGAYHDDVAHGGDTSIRSGVFATASGGNAGHVTAVRFAVMTVFCGKHGTVCSKLPAIVVAIGGCAGIVLIPYSFYA